MKRILFITQLYPSPSSGGTWKSWNVIEALLTAGFIVDVCCFYDKSFPLKKMGKKNLNVYFIEKRLVGIRFKNVPLLCYFSLFQQLPWRVAKFHDKRFRNLLCSLQEKKRYHVAVFETGSSLQFVEDIHIRQKVYVEQNIENQIARRRYKIHEGLLQLFWYFEYFLTKRYEKKYLQLIDKIWAISQRDAEQLKLMSSTPVAVLPISLTKNKKVKVMKKVKFILYTGLLSWEENKIGLEWFIKTVWTEVHKKNPQIKLLVVGKGIDEELEQHFLVKGVEYRGFIENIDELLFKIAPTSIAIAPVFSGSGIRVKVLNYVKFGIPTLTTEIGAEGIELSSLMVSNKREEWENILSKFIRNYRQRQKISDALLEEVKKNYSEKHLSNFLQKELG